MSTRVRNFVFTCNNYTDADVQLLNDIECRYVVFGYESAPTTGTPHLQGFICFRDACTLKAASRKLKRCSLQVANTISEAAEYCKKGGEFVERGVLPKDPKAKGTTQKLRWAAIRRACENKQYADLPDDFLCLHHRSYTGIRQLFLSQTKPLALTKLENYWYWGASGSGKSLGARAWIDERKLTFYLKDCTKWWDGYEHEQVALIEELSPTHIPMLTELLKKWSDYYPFPAEVKGGYMLIRPQHIIVTTNFSIEELFNTAMDREPINRRFNVLELTL